MYRHEADTADLTDEIRCCGAEPTNHSGLGAWPGRYADGTLSPRDRKGAIRRPCFAGYRARNPLDLQLKSGSRAGPEVLWPARYGAQPMVRNYAGILINDAPMSALHISIRQNRPYTSIFLNAANGTKVAKLS